MMESFEKNVDMKDKINNDLDKMLQYSFNKNTKEDLRQFYEAKLKYREDNTPDNLYFMKFYFQMLHASLKYECSRGTISPSKLSELADFVRD